MPTANSATRIFIGEETPGHFILLFVLHGRKYTLKKVTSYLTPLRSLSPSSCLFHKKGEKKAISKKDRGSQQETNKKQTNKSSRTKRKSNKTKFYFRKQAQCECLHLPNSITMENTDKHGNGRSKVRQIN
ncbi:hypothetical protein EO93_17260 [Methanosarcina sp. 1.H.A.2.2]|nr:hypothetical protein EO93_17260 [Methanosarcina sp. 1.H.A.2.2]